MPEKPVPIPHNPDDIGYTVAAVLIAVFILGFLTGIGLMAWVS